MKHIFDCMAIIPMLPFVTQPNKSLLDIGTGAGLPSVILAILKPDWHIDALDSNQKKIRFIRQISSEIGLKISCQLLLELSIIMPKKQVRTM